MNQSNSRLWHRGIRQRYARGNNIQEFNEIMMEYQCVMRDYQQNMNTFLCNPHGVTSPPSPPPTPLNIQPETTQNNQSLTTLSLISYMLRHAGNVDDNSSNLNEFANLFTDVLVHPTLNEIANATELVSYSIEQHGNVITCPISLDNFNENDTVIRIKTCGHIFNHESLHTWFRTNVNCPVCRYDIRDHVISPVSSYNPYLDGYVNTYDDEDEDEDMVDDV